jgi:hypothetical protein
MQSPPKFIPHFTVDETTMVCRPCWRALVLGKVTP